MLIQDFKTELLNGLPNRFASLLGEYKNFRTTFLHNTNEFQYKREKIFYYKYINTIQLLRLFSIFHINTFICLCSCLYLKNPKVLFCAFLCLWTYHREIFQSLQKFVLFCANNNMLAKLSKKKFKLTTFYNLHTNHAIWSSLYQRNEINGNAYAFYRHSISVAVTIYVSTLKIYFLFN